MPRARVALLAALAVAAVVATGPRPAARALATVRTDAGPARPGAPVLAEDGVYVPSTLDLGRPTPVLLALHGQGGSGPAIARRLQGCAEQHGWLLIAPTMAYRDYLDPDQVRRDAEENLPRVRALVARLPALLPGVRPRAGLLLYGFSRGAQMAHRFGLVYPREVAAVAVLSAGSYTLPEDQDAARAPLDFPFGVADLEAVGGAPFDPVAFGRLPFWIGVGGADANPADTARAWDRLEGRTRVERAQAFARQLQARGVNASLHVFGGTGHEETGTMRAGACAFLAAHAGDA
jgi:poly(3-hydroxybutyrate) depolymerase